MKQTNNAIKFLMAQYRAIFKHAYLKGLASAVILTTGLAAGSAQAAESIDNITDLASGSYENVASGVSNSTLNVAQKGNTVWNADLTLDGSKTSGSLTISNSLNSGNSGSATLIGSGSLTVKGATGASGSFTLTNSSGTGNDITANIKTVTVENFGKVALTATDKGKVTLGGMYNSNEYTTINLASGGSIELTSSGSNFASLVGHLNATGGTISNTASGGVLSVYGDNQFLNITAEGNSSGEGNVDLVFSLKKKDFGNNTTLQITSGDITLKKGSADGSGSAILKIEAGNLELADDANLVAISGSGKAAGVLVSGSSSDTATLTIDQEILTNFVKGADVISGTEEASGGILISGSGALFLNPAAGSDTVNLTELAQNGITFASGSDVKAGTVNVSGGTIKANALEISASDENLDLSAATLEADSLSLGSTSLTSNDSKGITFDKAIIGNTLNVTAQGTYELTGDVSLAAYTSSTVDGKTTYTGTTGVIKGSDLEVEGTTLSVEAGQWTAEQNLSLSTTSTSGSALSVKVDSDKKVDSTLVLKDGLTFNLDNDGKTATVTVDGGLNHEYGTQSGDKLAMLDLSSGIKVTNSSGSGTITATSGGIVKFDGDNLTEFLSKAETSGAPETLVAITAENGGKLKVEGDLTLEYTTASTENIKNMLSVGSGGYLDVSNSLVVTASGSGANADINAIGLSINESGTVRTKNLTLNNNLVDSTNNSKAENVYLDGGNFEVSSSLTSNNTNFILGKSDGSKSVTLTLATEQENGTGSINLTNLELQQATGKSSELDITQGNWSATNTNFKVTSGSFTIGGDETTASLEAKGLALKSANARFTVKANSSASFDTLDLSGASAGSADIDGTVTFDGVAQSDAAPTGGIEFGDTDNVLKVNQNASLIFGTNATYNAIYSGSSEGSVTLQDGFQTIDLQGGKVTLSFSGDEFSVKQLQSLKEQLFGSEAINGVLSIGNGSISDLKYEDNTNVPTITWENLKPVVEIASDVTDNKLSTAVVTGVNSGFQGQVGAVQAEGGSVTIANNTSLNSPENNNGFFISDSTGKTAGDATVTSGYTLTLNNTSSTVGKAGNISLTAGQGDNTTTLTVSGSAPVELGKVTGTSNAQANFMTNTTATEVKVAEVNVQKELTATLIESTNLEAQTGSTINSKSIETSDFTAFENSQTFVSGEMTVSNSFESSGDVNAQSLKLTADATSFLVNNNAAVNVENLTVTTTNSPLTLRIGQDSISAEDNGGVAVEGSAGYLFVNRIRLNGATIFADPDYIASSTLSAFAHFGDETATVGTIDGNIAIGKNAAIGLGTDEAGLKEAIASYQSNGALQSDKYGSILYLAESAILDGKYNISLNSSSNASTLEDAQTVLTYKDSDGFEKKADLGLGKNTAILINMDAFQEGNNSTPALHFDKQDAVVNAVGGEIVLTGDYDATSKLDIFSDNGNASDSSATGVKVTNDITVRTENGLMIGTIAKGDNAGQNVEMKVDTDNAAKILTGASTPVRDAIIAYGNGYTDAENKADSALHSGIFTDKNGQQVEVKFFNAVLNQSLTKGDGSTAEQVARLGVYGGSVQAALVAGESTYESIAGRMGVGAQTGNITFADNGQGAGLWVTPIYKNQDSDGFGAQGLSYGADLDLYGVALGGDFTLANGFRVGAAFNVGSGDADGQGAGAGVSNDFDYYGFAVYGGFTYDKLSIVGDVSYTVVDNDVDANTGVGKVKSDFDSSNLSVGVTAQYGLTYNGLDITPHAGLRYTYIDMDDYSVKGEDGNLAAYNGDSLSVFSIPVGVTFAKNFTAGDWTIKPALDLTLTANMGDDSMDGSVSWDGIQNLNTNVESEVLDDWTYGATLGVAAKSGNLSFGLGVNYTGASNADSYGVSANARFVF